MEAPADRDRVEYGTMVRTRTYPSSTGTISTRSRELRRDAMRVAVVVLAASTAGLARPDQKPGQIAELCARGVERVQPADWVRRAGRTVPTSMRMCVSTKYHFAYLRGSGKVGGTTIEQSYLVPLMCHTFFPASPADLANQNRVKTIWGGAVIRADCELKLKTAGLLDCGRLSSSMANQRHVFTSVRDPFARAVSIFKYLLVNSSQHVSFADALAGKQSTDIFRMFEGARNTDPFHWEQQLALLLPLCSQLPSIQMVRIEPNILSNLDTVVAHINEGRPKSLPALRLPSNGTLTRNEAAYDCPWPCYFQVCGRRCFETVLQWWSLDVYYMHILGMYRMPASIDDVWATAAAKGYLRDDGGTEGIDWARLSSDQRTVECRAHCTRDQFR